MMADCALFHLELLRSFPSEKFSGRKVKFTLGDFLFAVRKQQEQN